MNPPILATRNLGLDIGGANIVADVSLEVSEGELLGIIGPNGAGKTSLFNLFSGVYRPTAGSIHLNGVDITRQPTFLRAREGIGRTFQVSSVFPLLTAHENVRLAAEAAIGGTLRIWRRAQSVKPALERARAALVRVGLEAKALAPAGALSHGDKRRLEIAMLLASDRPVFLLDEPMAGLSAEHVPQLVELIRSVNEEEQRQSSKRSEAREALRSIGRIGSSKDCTWIITMEVPKNSSGHSGSTSSWGVIEVDTSCPSSLKVFSNLTFQSFRQISLDVVEP